MLLAVPMLMAFKAVCDHVDSLKAVADLLGTSDEPEPQPYAVCDASTVP